MSVILLVRNGLVVADAPAPTSWYNQPIFTTFLTLALGGLILNWLKERWAREEKRRDKTLEFLEDTGDRLNHLLSLIFGTLATGNLTDERLEELRLRRSPLFEKRFAVKLGAEAYLGSLRFSKDYEFLVNQLYELTEVLSKIAGRSVTVSTLLEEVKGRKKEVSERWPLDNESVDSVEGRVARRDDQLFNEVYRWNRMIWRRSLQLVSLHLRREFGLSRRILKEAPNP
jgi:hypothetical protein